MIERAGTGRRLQVITYQEIALPPLRRTGAPAMRGGADQFDPCCYFHHVRLVRQAISWLVITSNLLPVPALSIIHHQLLPTRTGNGQCYFLRFFELWLIGPEDNIYILGHQGYVMMRHFWLLQEKALSDIGVCVLEYRLS